VMSILCQRRKKGAKRSHILWLQIFQLHFSVFSSLVEPLKVKIKTSECKKAPNQAFCLLMMRPTFGNLTVDLLMKDKPVGSMDGMNWDEISIATISISFL